MLNKEGLQATGVVRWGYLMCLLQQSGVSPALLRNKLPTSMCSTQSLQVNATATLTRSVPHIGRASELPKRTVSSPAPPAPLVSETVCNGVR